MFLLPVFEYIFRNGTTLGILRGRENRFRLQLGQFLSEMQVGHVVSCWNAVECGEFCSIRQGLRIRKEKNGKKKKRCDEKCKK